MRGVHSMTAATTTSQPPGASTSESRQAELIDAPTRQFRRPDGRSPAWSTLQAAAKTAALHAALSGSTHAGAARAGGRRGRIARVRAGDTGRCRLWPRRRLATHAGPGIAVLSRRGGRAVRGHHGPQLPAQLDRRARRRRRAPGRVRARTGAGRRLLRDQPHRRDHLPPHQRHRAAASGGRIDAGDGPAHESAGRRRHRHARRSPAHD